MYMYMHSHTSEYKYRERREREGGGQEKKRKQRRRQERKSPFRSSNLTPNIVILALVQAKGPHLRRQSRVGEAIRSKAHLRAVLNDGPTTHAHEKVAAPRRVDA